MYVITLGILEPFEGLSDKFIFDQENNDSLVKHFQFNY